MRTTIEKTSVCVCQCAYVCVCVCVCGCVRCWSVCGCQPIITHGDVRLCVCVCVCVCVQSSERVCSLVRSAVRVSDCVLSVFVFVRRWGLVELYDWHPHGYICKGS